MKTRISRTLLLFLTAIVWATLAHGQTITIRADSVTACPSDNQIVVPILVEDMNSVGAISLALQYDTNVMTYANVYQNEHPEFSGGFLVVNSPGNEVRVGWFTLNSLDPMNIGDGKLIEFVFNYHGGTSALTWNLSSGLTQIADSTGNNVYPLVAVPGFVDTLVTPAITYQPVQDSIDEGDTTSFSITAIHSSIYQWQVSQDGGATYADLTDGAIYDGSMTPQLNINGALLSYDGNFYRCIASEPVCNAADTSMPALLQVEEICIPPLPFNVTGGGSYCSGGNGVAIGLDGTETGVDYTLFRNASDTMSIVAGTGSAISFGNITMAGTYTVIGSKACASTNMTGSVQVSINPLPNVYDVTGGGAYCDGDTGVNIGLSGSDTNTTYTLYFNGAATSNILSGTGNPLDFGTFTAAGTYSVQAVNSFGCSATMDLTGTIVINPLPVAYDLSGGGAYCDGGSGVDITLSGSETGIEYMLYRDGNASMHSLMGTGASISFTGITQAGTYTATALDTNTSCETDMNGSIEVTVNPLPMVSLDTLPMICVNAMPMTLSGGNPPGGVFSGNGVSAGMFDPAVAGTGTHSITYTFTDTNGCTASASQPITVSDIPVHFNVTGGGTYCPVNTAPEIMLDSSEAGVIYELLLDDTITAGIAPGTGSPISFGPQATPGTYTVRGTYGNIPPFCSTMMNGNAAVATLPLEPPIVSTDSLNAVTTNSAMVYAMVNLGCGSSIQERGLVWSTTPNPTTADNQIIDNKINVGSFTLQITGLNEGETYYVRAYATNNEGTTYGNELSFTTLITPLFNNVALLSSTDMSTWTAVNGTLGAGFDITLDPTETYYYLNFDNPATQANIPLEQPGYFGFTLDTYPAGFFTYWDGRGVNAAASPGTWQATMWEIINGNLPTFLIKINTDGSFMLVDGLNYALGMPDEYLKVNGDYHLGDYSYTGTISGENGVVSNPVTVNISFNGTKPEFTHVELRSTPDKVNWTDVAGSLTGGFALLLDSTINYYYVDLKNPETQTNIPLNEQDYFGFYVDTYPAGFFTYWANRGVDASATAGTWQAVMWEIINGNLPIFFIKSLPGGDLSLVDGLLRALGQPDEYLRINGDYLEGGFTFTGVVDGINGVPSDTLTIPVTITRKCIPPVVMAGPDDLNICQGTDATFSITAAGSSPFSYQWKFNGADISGATSASYTITAADLQHEGNYSCMVTNDCGDTLSQEASLSIKLPPAITSHPISTNVLEGDPATFDVSADQASSYQWQLSIDGGNSWTNLSDGTDYSGTHTAQLSVTNPVIAMNGYSYRCIVSGDCAPNAYSQTATLIVVKAVSVIITEAPHMTATPGDTIEVPVSVENLYGTNAIALTMGYDAAVLSFVEFRDSHPALAGSPIFINDLGGEVRLQWFSLLPVNIGNDILVKYAFEYHGGYTPLLWKLMPLEACQYGDLQSNPYPAIFINGSVNGQSSISISQHPQNTSTCLGSQATFSITASGATGYLWEVSDDGGASWTALSGNANYSGATSPNLTVLSTNSAMHLNLFRCQLTDGISTIYSAPAYLKVTPWANLNLPVHANPGDTVCSGSSVMFSIPGDTILINPSYNWFLNGIAAGNGSTFNLAVPADGDVITCSILSEELCAAITTAPVTISVDPVPSISQQPVDQMIYEGDTAMFSVSSPNAATYQWQLSTNNGSSWADLSAGPSYSGVNSTTLMVNGADLSMDGYQYRCVVTEMNCGQQVNSDPAMLTVKQLPIYTSVPSLTACAGDQIVVPVTAMNFNNVASASLRLTYDTTVLSFVDTQNVNNAFAGGVMLINQNGDQISVAFFGANPANIGDGLLFELIFTYNGGATSLTWDPLPAYTMYTNPLGLTLEAYFTDGMVSSKPLPVAYDVTGGGSYCDGGSGVSVGLAGSDSGIDYELFLDGNPTGNIVSGTGLALGFGNQTSAGTYTVHATNATTGCVNMMNGNAIVSVDPLPAVSLNLTDSSLCVNEVAITLSGGTPLGGTYSGTAVSSGEFDPLAAGTGIYTITYTYTDTNGCVNSATDQLIVNPAPVLLISPPAPVICDGESVTLSTPGSNSYVWNTGDTTPSISVSPAATTTYSVTATNMFGCIVSEDVTVTVNPLPVLTLTANTDTICEGGWATLDVSGADSYAWSTGSTSNSITVSPAATQTYTVTGTNTFGCSDSAALTIYVNPLPAITITPATINVCDGDSATLTAMGGISYTWSDGSQSSSISVAPAVNTTYTVTGTDANGCQNTASADVNIDLLPTVFNVTGGGAYCMGGSGAEVGLDGSQAGVAYTLYLDGNTTSNMVYGNGSAISFGFQTIAGTYTVMAQDTATSCMNSMNDAAVVSIDPMPSFSAQPMDTTIKIGGTATFSAVASPAAAYQWQVSTDQGTTWTDLTNIAVYSGVNTNTLSVGPVGMSYDGNWYRLMVMAASCDAYSAPAMLTIDPVIPTITLTAGSGQYCPGDTVLIPVDVTNFDFAAELELNISWDPAVLNYLSIQNPHPAVASGNITINTTSGSLQLIWTGGPVFGGNTSLGSLEMVYQGGTSGLNWMSASSYVLNGLGDTIPTAYVDGAIDQASQPPVVNTMPADQILIAGDSVSFGITASGANAYQWQVSSDQGTSWSDLVNGAVYAGVNTATLMVNGASVSLDSNLYRCMVYEAVCGLSDISAAALLQVIPAGLVIHTSLDDYMECPNTTVTVPVDVENFYNVSATSLSIAYDTNVIDFSSLVNVDPQFATGTLIANQANGKLNIGWFSTTPVWLGDVTLFEIEFDYFGGMTNLTFDTLNYGQCQYNDPNGAILAAYFTSGMIEQASTPPIITGQPQDLTVMETVAAYFTVNTNVSGASYQWELSIDGGLNWTPLSNGTVYNGVNTATLEVTSPALAMDGYAYRCIVTENICGLETISDPAVMSVIPFNTDIVTTIPDIISCPDTIKVPVIVSNVDNVYSISLTLDIDTNKLQYLGFSNVHPELQGSVLNAGVLSSSQLAISWFSLTEAEIAFDTLLELEFYYSGGYVDLSWDTASGQNCLYSDFFGAGLDDVYEDGSIDSPGPTMVSDPLDTTVDDGDTATFSVSAINASAYQWQFSSDGGINWTNLVNGSTFNGVTTNTLEITPANISMDGYLFRVIISGSCPDIISEHALLTVTPPLPLVTVSIGTMNACEGNITIPIRIANLIGVSSFDLALWYNTDSLVLDYQGFNNAHPALSSGNLSVTNLGDTVIQISFSASSPVTVGTDSLIFLQFTGTRGNTNLRWNTNDPLACEFIDPQGYSFPEHYLNGSIRVNPLPLTPGMPIGADSICIGSSSTMYMLADSVRFADYYTWTISPALAGTILGSGLTASVSWNPIYSGNATIDVTAHNGCGSGPTSPALQVNVNTKPGTAANPTGPVTLCMDDPNTTYTTTGATNASGYDWMITPSNAGTLISSGTQVEVDWNANFSGYAVLTVRGSNSCGNGLYAPGLLITVYPGISVDLGPDMTVCASQSAVISAGNPGASYLWSTGATTQSIVVDTTGLGLGTFTFSVTVTSNVGCTASDSVMVTFDPCVGTPEIGTELSMAVYPNPTRGIINISLEGLQQGSTEIFLMNMIGELIYSESLSEGDQKLQKQMDISHLPTGIYLLRMNNGDQSITRKVILQ